MRKQSGFTLAEMLIAFGIISVIVGAALITLKPFDRNIKYLYSATFHSLDKALYNAITYWVNEDRNKRNERDPFIESYTENGTEVKVTPIKGTERLCTALTEYMTSIGGKCSSANIVSDSANNSEFKEDKVQFKTTNGVRYWISKRMSPSEGVQGPKFFIIYADMNGVKPPNSIIYEKGVKDPDIFAFAALENGRICPLGPPEVDSRYLTTRIMFRKQSGANSDDLEYSEPSQEYVKSKAEAWGYYLSDATQQGRGDFTDEYIMEEAPFSYNGYIRSVISTNSKIYSFLKGKTMSKYFEENFNNVHLMKNAPDEESDPEYGCKWRSADECNVTIDKYVW